MVIKDQRISDQETNPVVVQSVALAKSTSENPRAWPPAALKPQASCISLWVPFLPPKLAHLNSIISEILSTTRRKFCDFNHSQNPTLWKLLTVPEGPSASATCSSHSWSLGVPASLPAIAAGVPQMCRALLTQAQLRLPEPHHLQVNSRVCLALYLLCVTLKST